MNIILIIIVALLASYSVITGCFNENKLYRFPFLFSSILLSFSVPQLIGLNISESFPDFYLTRLLWVIIICQIVVYMTDYFKKKPFKVFHDWNYSYLSLVKVSVLLSLVGSIFFFLISRLPENLTNQTQWTGLPVLYLFFSHLLTYGFAIAVWLTIYNKRLISFPLAIVIYDTIFYFDRIIIAGRRAEAAEFILIIALSFWFHRRVAPKPYIIFGTLIIGTLLMHSIGDYRSNSLSKGESTFDNLSNIEFLDNFDKQLTKGGEEMKNSAYIINYSAENLSFDYGLFHWNRFVFSYVPAQLVGADIKSFLMIKLPANNLDNTQFTIKTGSTMTGFSDAFRSFGYLGFVKFILISFLMAGLYNSAVNGNVTIQLLYMLLVTDSMHTVTHSTHHMIAEIPHIVVFLILPLWFAKSKKIH